MTRRRGLGAKRILLAALSLWSVLAAPAFMQERPSAVTAGQDAPADSYYVDGRLVSLRRSNGELTAKFGRAIPNRRDAILATSAPQAEVVAEIASSRGQFQLVRLAASVTASQNAEVRERLAASDEVEFAGPVFYHPSTGTKLLLTDEAIVAVRPDVEERAALDFAASIGWHVSERIRGTRNQWVLRRERPKESDLLREIRQLFEAGWFDWVEPNFIQQLPRAAFTNDPLLHEQWYLRNPGNYDASAGADVRALDAWDAERGNGAVTIAILDDGVDLAHEDLAANIFINTGETPDNGLDDDGNGYVDDVNGWDFSNDDNDPSPLFAEDVHGTAVAGLAAARGDNRAGIAGVCHFCRILPVKIFSPDFAGTSAVANAIRYAASLADVISNSWGGGAPSAAISSALDDATSIGRNGKGAVVLFAAGNSASAGTFRSYPIRSGTHRFRFEYVKDGAGAAGEDTAWLSWVLFPTFNYPRLYANFEAATGAAMPPGWVTGGDAPWTVVTDPRRSDESLCLTRAAKAGPLADGQTGYLEIVKTLEASGSVSYFSWVSSAANDGLRLRIDLDNNGTYDEVPGYPFTVASGTSSFSASVAYPASHPQVIAVGATSDRDCRSYYSQYGSALDIVAPSNGSLTSLSIQTTDRSGLPGYTYTNYVTFFGGTSASTPLVAGAAGLVLSRNPTLTGEQVREILQASADKVGPEPYVDGRNDRYGYGRLNVRQALLLTPVPPPAPPTFVLQPKSRVLEPGTTVSLSAIATGLGVTYQWFQGSSGDTSQPVSGATFDTVFLGTPSVTTRYWVRATNPSGSVDSVTATVTVATFVSAAYEAALSAPGCVILGGVCDSMQLLFNRGTLGPEQNHPNTIWSACSDGSLGAPLYSFESVDRIRVSSVDGSPFAPGAEVSLDIAVWAFSSVSNYIDVYHANDALAPEWTRLATIRPAAEGSAIYRLPLVLGAGGIQAVRVKIRYEGSDEPCSEGIYNDHDDLFFVTTAQPISAGQPSLLNQPRSQRVPTGQSATLAVRAVGGPPLLYQWYSGAAGDTTSPLPGATQATFSTGPVTVSKQYWVRVSNAAGSVDSAAAAISPLVAMTASYSSALGAPVCLTPAAQCDSGGLLSGRGGLGPELNAPNTIGSACSDGTVGIFHRDESNDRLRVSTVDGEAFSGGKVVRVEASVWSFSLASNQLEIYAAADARNPVWTQIATLRPTGSGAQMLSATYVLPGGNLQAVRARFRYKGTPGSCGSSGYDDHDDLAFAVGGPVTLETTPIPIGPTTAGLSSALLWPGMERFQSTTRGTVSSAINMTQQPSSEADVPSPPGGPSFMQSRSGSAPAASSTAPVAVSQRADEPARPALAAGEGASGLPPSFGVWRSFSLTYPGRLLYAEVSFRTDQPAERETCTLYLERATNTLLLVSDDGRDLLSGQVGTAGRLGNSQCAIDLESVRFDAAPDGATMSLTVQFNERYTVTDVYQQTVDIKGLSSGWTKAAAIGTSKAQVSLR